MIWYSPELDQIMVILINVISDIDVTNVNYKVIGNDLNEENVKNYVWYYIGEL